MSKLISGALIVTQFHLGHTMDILSVCPGVMEPPFADGTMVLSRRGRSVSFIFRYGQKESESRTVHLRSNTQTKSGYLFRFTPEYMGSWRGTPKILFLHLSYIISNRRYRCLQRLLNGFVLCLVACYLYGLLTLCFTGVNNINKSIWRYKL